MSARGSLAQLSPANFAIAMATGILGVAAHQQGFDAAALVLLVLAIAAWSGVALLAVVRARLHPRALLADLHSHQRAPGFFTAVAGTSVICTLWLALGFSPAAGTLLAAIAMLLWVALTYGVLFVLTVQPDKPPLDEGISGAWLLVVVSTQSVAAVATTIAAAVPQPARLVLNAGALAMWLAGGMLYVWVISLIFYRYTFFRFRERDLTPTYWINMGAMAISTLAGGLLVVHAADAPLLLDLAPFVKGVTLLCWAVGSWWIPLLAALVAWRYLWHRYPVRYDVGYWAAVFPLGMYSAATHQLSLAFGLRFLAPLARGFFWAAVAVWAVVAIGLLRHVARVLLQPDP